MDSYSLLWQWICFSWSLLITYQTIEWGHHPHNDWFHEVCLSHITKSPWFRIITPHWRHISKNINSILDRIICQYHQCPSRCLCLKWWTHPRIRRSQGIERPGHQSQSCQWLQWTISHHQPENPQKSRPRPRPRSSRSNQRVSILYLIRSSNVWWIVLIIVGALVLLGLVGFFFYKKRKTVVDEER